MVCVEIKYLFVGLEFFLKYFITPEVKNRFVLPNPRFYKLKNIRI